MQFTHEDPDSWTALVSVMIGRTPTFEDILGVLVADIHRLHAHVQQCHELDSRMYDIEQITSEDIEEVCICNL